MRERPGAGRCGHPAGRHAPAATAAAAQPAPPNPIRMESLESCGAEVQKGNAPEERKLQRLFRNPEATRLIKRCNDFGAGGVSVAIGELADGLHIDLNKVPKKYEGLDGTELAISESQERMAVVVAKEDAETFRALASTENLESTVVAEVTEQPRLVMELDGRTIVDLSREFLNSNGAKKFTTVAVLQPQPEAATLEHLDFAGRMEKLVDDLNILFAERAGGTVRLHHWCRNGADAFRRQMAADPVSGHGGQDPGAGRRNHHLFFDGMGL